MQLSFALELRRSDCSVCMRRGYYYSVRAAANTWDERGHCSHESSGGAKYHGSSCSHTRINHTNTARNLTISSQASKHCSISCLAIDDSLTGKYSLTLNANVIQWNIFLLLMPGLVSGGLLWIQIATCVKQKLDPGRPGQLANLMMLLRLRMMRILTLMIRSDWWLDNDYHYKQVVHIF